MSARASRSDALAGLGADELRAAVREVLREVLPPGTLADAPAAPAPAGAGGARRGEVVVATDGDLTALVRRVAALCEDPQVRAELQAGRHGFQLVSPASVRTAAGASPDGSATRVERGAVTERTVVKAARSGSRLLLGRGAVLTPLARDKARSLGVEIERER